MNDKEREEWLKELASRTVLWERKREHAKKRMQLEGVEALGRIDLEVAEGALERIEAKRQEVLDEEKAEHVGYYPVPMEVPEVGDHTHTILSDGTHTHNLSSEEAGGAQYAKITAKKGKGKKKVHKHPGAAFALVVPTKEDKK